MRSILIFVAVVVVSLAAYSFLAKEAEQPQGPKAGQVTYQAPKTQRPRVGAGGHPESSDPVETEIGDFSWRKAVSDKYLVRMEDAWGFDLSGVDFSKELLCRVGGVDIKRDDLRAWICVKYGQAVINTRLYTAVGRMAAEETGIPYGMDDDQWELFFNDWLAGLGVDKQTALANMAIQMSVPMEAVESLRRDMVETLLACFPAVESVDELPLSLSKLIVGEDQRRQAASLGMLMRGIIAKLKADNGRLEAPIAGLVDPMSMLFSGAGAELRFRRMWTSLVGNLPPGALAAIYTGPIDDEQMLPPWEHEGDRELLSIDEVWALLEGSMRPSLLRANLREVIWSKVLKAQLASSGNLPDMRSVWQEFADDYVAHKVTVFNMDFVIRQRGYPSRSIYLEDMLITGGFLNSQDSDWQDETKLREFFDKNSFLIMGWEPSFELALFVPRDPAQGMGGDEDWARAKSEAEAFKARVSAGADFTELRTAHNRELVESIRNLSQSMGDAFAQEFGTGEFKSTMEKVSQILRQTLWTEHVDGVSPLRNVAVRLDVNDVSPPWKTPAGYIVVRMGEARLDRLEREFEDMVEQTRNKYATWVRRMWVTEQLSGLKFELP